MDEPPPNHWFKTAFSLVLLAVATVIVLAGVPVPDTTPTMGQATRRQPGGSGR